MWESENQDESPLMTTDNFHGIDRLVLERASKHWRGTLQKNGGRIDGSGCLVRTKKIEKLAHGGDRSQDIHLESIVVKNVNLIKGKDILLLDDVTKTGNSLEACTLLLLEAGARSVQRATIGKT